MSATICCTRPGEEIVLLLFAETPLDRTAHLAEVGDGLAQLTESGAVEQLARGHPDRELGERRGILPWNCLA